MSSKCMIILASPKPTIMSEINTYDPNFDKVSLVYIMPSPPTPSPPVVLRTIEWVKHININVLVYDFIIHYWGM